MPGARARLPCPAGAWPGARAPSRAPPWAGERTTPASARCASRASATGAAASRPPVAARSGSARPSAARSSETARSVPACTHRACADRVRVGGCRHEGCDGSESLGGVGGRHDEPRPPLRGAEQVGRSAQQGGRAVGQAVVGPQGRAQAGHAERRRPDPASPSTWPHPSTRRHCRSKSVPKATAPVPAATTAPGPMRPVAPTRFATASLTTTVRRAPSPSTHRAQHRRRGPRGRAGRAWTTRRPRAALRASGVLGGSPAQQGRGVGHEGGHVDAAGPDPRARRGEHGTRPPAYAAAQARAADVRRPDDRRRRHGREPITSPCRRSTPRRSAWWRRRNSTMSGMVVMTSPAKTAE